MSFDWNWRFETYASFMLLHAIIGNAKIELFKAFYYMFQRTK